MKKEKSQLQNQHKTVSIFLLVALLLFAGVMFWLKKVYSNSQTPELASTEVPAPPSIKSISSKMLFMGTTFWGRYTHDWSMASDLKYAYPFSRLNEFNLEEYDAWIAGLECPTSSRVSMTSAQQEANLQFNCRPEFLPEASKWFTVFGLSNNHTDNQGAEGFEETKQELDKHGIQYFGHYEPENFDDICEVVSLPAKLAMSNGQTVQGEIPVALCGYHGFLKNPSKASRAVLSEYAKYFPTIALPHSGVEYKAGPDKIKTDLYRELISNGADAVLGDHPHWVQNTEAYRGRLIVYSMGNFMFDQQYNQEVTRSAVISLELNASEADNSLEQFKAWTRLAKTCGKFKDDCLTQAKEKNLSKLNYQYKFGVIGSDNANKLVKPASEAQTQAILQRLRWAETASQLTAPYSAS